MIKSLENDECDEEMRDKLNIMTNKYITIRKERDQLLKENKELNNEILLLQSNMRQMIPGFSSNTSSSFPMLNELQNRLSEFVKCDCLDIFFDLLSPELNMEGIIFFYKSCFEQLNEYISTYFDPLINSLKKTLCFTENNLHSSIDNVLRKSYQGNWRKILDNISNSVDFKKIINYIQSQLNLQDNSHLANQTILEFLNKSLEILFFCYICDPVIVLDFNSMGNRIIFNTMKFESMDGFIKQKHECYIILPGFYKFGIANENIIIKAQVLPFDYEFP